MRLIIFAIVILELFLAAKTEMQECSKISESSRYTYSRTLLMRYVGPASLKTNQTTAAMNIGTCGTMRGYAALMRRHFEGFGIDLSTMNELYETFDDERFQISSYVTNPAGNFRVLLSSFYEYAQVKYEKVSFLFWLLTAKTDLTGPRGRLPADTGAIHGLFRFKEYGSDVCIPYIEATPIYLSSAPTVVHLLLKNKYWGNGTLSGLEVYASNGTVDGKYFMAFPGSNV